MIKEIPYDIIHDAQSQFRIILDAFSRPGIVNYFEKDDLNPPKTANIAMANIALALLNGDTSVYTDNLFCEFKEYLEINTLAKFADPNQAEFLFLSGHSDHGLINSCNKGSLQYPEKGCTVIVLVDALNSELTAGTHFSLTGPGIKTKQLLKISGLSKGIVEAIKEVNADFLLGIELIFTDKNNRFVAIPRSSKIEIEKWDM